MRFLHIDTGRLLGLKNELVCPFVLAADMVGGGIMEFVNEALYNIITQ